MNILCFAEPVENLFFTQQFPTMQPPIVTTQMNARNHLPPLGAISMDSPAPALDYHSSSAESLNEIPMGWLARGSFSNASGGYQQPLDKWHLNHYSHPNLMNGNQWQHGTEPLRGGVKIVDSKAKSSSHVNKSKRKAPVPMENGQMLDVKEPSERQQNSNQEPLLSKYTHETESHQAHSGDSQQGIGHSPDKKSERKRSKQTIQPSDKILTIADVHQECDKDSVLNRSASNGDRPQEISEPQGDIHPSREFHLEQESREASPKSDPKQEPPLVVPKPEPRKRSHKPSQTSLQSTASSQHIVEGDDKNRIRNEEPQRDNSPDAISLPGSIPQVPPLDLRALADTYNSNVATVTQREPPSASGSLSDEDLVEGYLNVKTLEPQQDNKILPPAERPLANKRWLLRY